MTFQASDGKGRQFLDLLDDNFNIIKSSYTKGGSWLQSFGHLNLLCTCATRAIISHTPIGEYRLKFFPNKEFKCPCGTYPIKSRRHILHNCIRFNRYWNPRWDFLSHFVMFLKANPNCCSNHLLQWQMISLTSKSLSKVIMWKFYKRTQQGASS